MVRTSTRVPCSLIRSPRRSFPTVRSRRTRPWVSSAFYIALLTTFCGFLGAVIVNTSIDAVLGYATTEIGLVWRQRQPVAISRRQTLLAKWVMAVGLTVILTGLMLFTAVVILGNEFASLGIAMAAQLVCCHRGCD